jgi:hypothetical protein
MAGTPVLILPGLDISGSFSVGRDDPAEIIYYPHA